MADEDLQELKRRWQSTGDLDTGERYLRARLRAGTLTLDAVRIAADLGDHVAVRLQPGEWPDDPFPESTHLPAWASAHWGTEALVEAAVAAAGLAPTEAEGRRLNLPHLDMPAWTRLQAQARWKVEVDGPASPTGALCARYGGEAPGLFARIHAAGLLGCAVRVAEEFSETDPRPTVRRALVPWLFGDDRDAPEPPPRPRYVLARFRPPGGSAHELDVILPLVAGIPTLIPFPQPGGRLCLGRTLPDADYGLEAVGVSRSQCWLDCDADGEIWIEDARSAGGTYVNDRQISRQRVVPGDILGRSHGYRYRVLPVLDAPPPVRDASAHG